MTIKKVFENLTLWRNLPAYQLERRLDIFLTPYLKKILKSALEDEDIISVTIIPEFPIPHILNKKKGTSFAHSNKVDYLAITKSKNRKRRVVFIELKTDAFSFTNKQFSSLKLTCKNNMKDILKSQETLIKRTIYRQKYAFFLDLLSNYKIISKWPKKRYKESQTDSNINNIFNKTIISPNIKNNSSLFPVIKDLRAKKPLLVYIGPSSLQSEVKKQGVKFFSLKDVAKLVKRDSDYGKELYEILMKCDKSVPKFIKKEKT